MTYDEYDANPDVVEEEFADIDDLLYGWEQFLYRELQSFKVIRSDLFGTGCVCDLKTIFLENNFTPDYVMELIPRVKDCYTDCLSMEYNKYMTMFTNLNGAPMSVSDLAQDEIYFYNKFVEIVEKKVVFNTWDLWGTKDRAGN
jgi:hypothetical protein